MAKQLKENNPSLKNPSCVVCCQNVPGPVRKAIFAIGPCDHPICYHCCTKIRVLCRQIDCAICRQDMNEVCFTPNPQAKFSEIKEKGYLNSDFKIYFQTKDCLKTFEKLIEERCNLCFPKSPCFKSISELNEHLRNEHDRYTCDICVNNLKIFSEERRYYKKNELIRHLNRGDNDRSYQGHPKCEFDDARFMDNEDLNRHLRRDHYCCHFCDLGQSSKFLATYAHLKEHFRKKHFLCEEGDCKNEEFTKVFKTSIDLQVHKAQAHCSSKSKSKSAKTLSLDFLFLRGSQSNGPHSLASSFHNSASPSQSSRKDSRLNYNSNHYHLSSNFSSNEKESLGSSFFPVTCQQIPKEEDFPLLKESVPISSKGNTNSNLSKSHQKVKNFSFSWKLSGQSLGQKNEEEFPALSNFEQPSLSMPSTSGGLSAAEAVKSKSKPNESLKTSQSPTFKSSAVNDYYPPPYLALSSAQNGNSKCSKKNSNSRLLLQTLQFAEKDFSVKQEDFPALPLRLTATKKKKRPSSSTLTLLSSNHSNELTLDSKLDNLQKSSINQFESTKMTKDFKNVLIEDNLQSPSTSQPSHSNIYNINEKEKQSKGANQPPPGYENFNGFSNFSLDLNSLAEQVILSEKEQSKSNLHSNHSYIRPNDWDQRSKGLQKKIDYFLKTQEMRENFRFNSKQFQNYRMKAHEYYTRCIEMLGRHKFNQILVDLITLLPDIKKQNELLTEHEKHVNKKTYNLGPSNPATSGEWEIKVDPIEFLVCPTCQQVLGKKDGNVHILSHWSNQD